MADEASEPAMAPSSDTIAPVDNSVPPENPPPEAASKTDNVPVEETKAPSDQKSNWEKVKARSLKKGKPGETTRGEQQKVEPSQDGVEKEGDEDIEPSPSEASAVEPLRPSKWHRLATRARGQTFVPPSTGRKIMDVPDCWPHPELSTWRLLEYRDKLHLPPWFNWKLTAGMACTGFTPTDGQWDGAPFDLWDPEGRLYGAGYHPLKDAALGRFVKSEGRQKILLYHGLITKDRQVIVSLREFNQWRRNFFRQQLMLVNKKRQIAMRNEMCGSIRKFIDGVKADDNEPAEDEAEPENAEGDAAREETSTEPSQPKKQKVDKTNPTDDRTITDQYKITEEVAGPRFDPTVEEEALIKELLLLHDYIRQIRRETGMYERSVVKRKRDLKEQRRREALLEKIQVKEEQVAERRHLIKTALTEEDRQERREEELDRRTRFRQTMEQLNVDMAKSSKADQDAKVAAWKAYFASKHHSAEPVLPSGNQPDERYRSQLVEEQKAKNGGKLPDGPQFYPVPIKAGIKKEDETTSNKQVKEKPGAGKTNTESSSSSKSAGKKEAGKQPGGSKNSQNKSGAGGASSTNKNPPIKKVKTDPAQAPQKSAKDTGKTKTGDKGPEASPSSQPLTDTSGSQNKDLKPLKSAMSKMGARSDTTGNASHIQFSADVGDDPAVPTAKKSSEMFHDSAQPKQLLGKEVSENEIAEKAEEAPGKTEDGVDVPIKSAQSSTVKLIPSTTSRSNTQLVPQVSSTTLRPTSSSNSIKAKAVVSSSSIKSQASIKSQRSRTAPTSKTSLSQQTASRTSLHSETSDREIPVRNLLSERTLALLSTRSRVRLPEPEKMAQALFQDGPRPGASRTNLTNPSNSLGNLPTGADHSNYHDQQNARSRTALHPVRSNVSTNSHHQLDAGGHQRNIRSAPSTHSNVSMAKSNTKLSPATSEQTLLNPNDMRGRDLAPTSSENLDRQSDRGQEEKFDFGQQVTALSKTNLQAGRDQQPQNTDKAETNPEFQAAKRSEPEPVEAEPVSANEEQKNRSLEEIVVPVDQIPFVPEDIEQQDVEHDEITVEPDTLPVPETFSLRPVESLLPGERKTPSGYTPLELSMSKILDAHPNVTRGETERPLYGLPPPPKTWQGGKFDYDGGKTRGHEPQVVSRGPHAHTSATVIGTMAQPKEETRFGALKMSPSFNTDAESIVDDVHEAASIIDEAQDTRKPASS